ncbi:hypothetical protein ASE38_01085 [Cellulomonas sp. Root930]|nr:hypothetical protein ASE38_01085 [Cellulomonas sp. Root930]
MSTTPSDQNLRNRLRERLKFALRGGLQFFDLELSRGSFAGQVSRTLSAHGITEVLDIGANVGQYALSLRRAGFAGRIISCEPLSGAFGELKRRAARDDSWHPVRTAVGSSTGLAQINVAGNSYSSSILSMAKAHLDAAPDSAYIAVERVPVTTVAELVGRFDVDPARTLLKIDTQGFESAVLDGAGDQLNRFEAVQLELSFVELYDGQQLAGELFDRLRGLGYRLQSFAPGLADNDGRLLQCDLLAVREG